VAAVKDNIRLTVNLPADVMERVCLAASEGPFRVEREALTLIRGAMNVRRRTISVGEQAYRAYQAHLARIGGSEPGSVQHLEQLKMIRDEMANEPASD